MDSDSEHINNVNRGVEAFKNLLRTGKMSSGEAVILASAGAYLDRSLEATRAFYEMRDRLMSGDGILEKAWTKVFSRDWEPSAELAFGASKFNVSLDDLIVRREQIERSLNIKGKMTADWVGLCAERDERRIETDLTILSFVASGGPGEATNIFKQLLSEQRLKNAGLSTYEAGSCLTSATLAYGYERVVSEFVRLSNKDRRLGDQRKAILTLAGLMKKDTVDVYEYFTSDEMKSAERGKIKVLDEQEGDRRAILTLAGIIGNYSPQEVVNLYRVLEKSYNIPLNTAARLVLLVATTKSGTEILSREAEYFYSLTGKISRIYPAMTVILLSH